MFCIRTIPPAFRRGGARSSRCTEPFRSHNHCKRITTPRPSPTLPKPHYPTPHTNTLASPRKRGGGLQTSERLENSALLCDISNAGIFAIILSARRWGLIPISTINEIFRTIPQKALSLLPYERSVGFASLRNSGRSTSGIHARPLSKVRCCRRKNSGDYRRDCHSTNPPKTAPSLACTITLASLVKGRWIDGKAQTVALLRFACDTSTFLIYQTFCRQDGGIASPPSLACTNPPKTALSPEKALYPFTTQPFLHILDISFYPCYTFISVSEN